MEPLFQTLAHYGYVGLFAMLVLGIAGLPIPDETLLVITGVLVARGTLQLPAALGAAIAGSIAGISFSYLIGRSAAAPLIYRYGKYIHITPDYVDRMHKWFQSTGEWLLTFGYFIPGVRHFTALVAGMSRLEYLRFAAFAYSGAVLWISTFIGLGYFLGDNWENAMQLVHRYTNWAILLVAIAAGVAYLVRRRIRKTLAGSTPPQTAPE